MSTTKDGGPAFPQMLYDSSTQGMKLRDWFAGMALQGNLASQSNGYSYGGRWHQAAIESYQIADAMLDARERKEEK